MEVSCERCHSEYEFEETLVADRGTTVKCTHCGHVFRVYRPGTAAAQQGSSSWTVRTADGRTETIATLRDLQRRIAARELTEDDEISRGGGGFKRLGDIAELHSFFAASYAARQATGQAILDSRPPRRRDDTPLGLGPVPYPYSTSHPPPPASEPPDTAMPPPPALPNFAVPGDGSGRSVLSSAPPNDTLYGVDAHEGTPSTPIGSGFPAETTAPTIPVPNAGLAWQGLGVATTQAASVPATPNETPLPPSEAPTVGFAALAPAPAVSTGFGVAATVLDPGATRREGPAVAARARLVADPALAPVRRSEYPPATPAEPVAPRLHVDEDDEPALPTRTGARKAVAMLLLVLVPLAVGVALGWERIEPFLKRNTDVGRTSALIASGSRSLYQAHDDAYRLAIRDFRQAVTRDDQSTDALVHLSRAHAHWAQKHRFDASDAEMRSAQNVPRSSDASRPRHEADRQAALALRFARKAFERAADGPSAALVMSDALRLTGDLLGARHHLDRAVRLGAGTTVEALRVRALLAADEPNGTMAAAHPHLLRAVQRDPARLDLRLLLARAQLALRDVAAAQRQVDEVLARRTDHADALRLRDAITRGLPPAPAVVNVVTSDAAVATAADAGTPSDPPTTSPPSTSPEAIPKDADYAWFVRHGDARLERNDPSGARDMFEAALRLRAMGPEALTGLGFVALNTGNAQLAIDRFRPAAQNGYDDAYIGLGDAYRRIGRNADALAAYEAYLSRKPNGRQASIARAQVNRLKDGASGSTRTSQRAAGAENAVRRPPPHTPAPSPSPEPTVQSDPPAIGSEP